MKKNLCIILAAVFSFSFGLFASEPSIESVSRIDWVSGKFVSNISMDTEKADIQMPSGKKKASASIKTKMPQLIQPPLLSLYTDSNDTLSDNVIYENLTFDDIYHFIMNGYKTPDVFSSDIKTLNTTNTLNVKEIGSLLVNHKYPYSPEEPIDTVPSRPYSGIIIDARGQLPVHGEYVKSTVSACFFDMLFRMSEKMAKYHFVTVFRCFLRIRSPNFRPAASWLHNHQFLSCKTIV